MAERTLYVQISGDARELSTFLRRPRWQQRLLVALRRMRRWIDG